MLLPIRTAAAAALVSLLAVPTAAAVRASTSGPPVTGDPAGVRLARDVNRAYANVPGVRVDVTADGELFARFTLVMRKGVVVAEQALVYEGSGRPTLLVQRENEGTWARDSGRACWRYVPKGDPQALTDVGTSMFPSPGRVSKPRATGGTITVTQTAKGQTARLVIDRKTLRLRRMDAAGAVVRFTNLAKRPKLPVPKPRCG
jgi:hypothetical protein